MEVQILDTGEFGVFVDKKSGVVFLAGGKFSNKDDCALTHLEAIAAAKAILKHFNAYEENISGHYRAPTDDEMAKFLADNPNYKPIPKEAYDPDTPLTSELSQHFGDE